MKPQTLRSDAAAVSAAPDPVRVAQCNDATVLASVIERNRAIINNGWEQLERLTLQLEALNAHEARIVQEELKVSHVPKAPSSDSSVSQ